MIRINEIKLPLDKDESELINLSARRLGCRAEDISDFRILKKAVDSRKKNDVHFVYNVAFDVRGGDKLLWKTGDSKISYFEAPVYSEPENKRTSELRPVIAGFGPAGFFSGLILARAGLRPIIFERGSDVDKRSEDVKKFWSGGALNTESNVQFGEGGAGTFSDGKLTTGIKDPLCMKVLEELVLHGAPEEILYSSTPHIGTDRLPGVVKSIRKEIEALGGEVFFDTKLEDIIIANGSVQGVTVSGARGVKRDIEADTLLLCIGHSSRDTFEMLYRKGFNMIQKPFSVGVRIEHPRQMIDRAQYGDFAGHPKLGAAVYKLACHPEHGRGAYTFCMCPGGTVSAAASEERGCVVNGMSEYARDGENSNSAVLVGIEPSDFGSEHALAGVELQRKIEREAFRMAGENYSCPGQTLGDFMQGKTGSAFTAVKPTCPTGVTPCDLNKLLPLKVTETMKQAMDKMDNMLKGFAMPEAVLTAPETRSSSPVRILRNDILQANIRGVYPCGEGAGYAGGIVSAAVDGIKCAHAVLLDETDEW